MDDAGARLETGWDRQTPIGDNVVHDYLAGDVQWVGDAARAAGDRFLLTDLVMAVDEGSPETLLNYVLLLRPCAAPELDAALDDLRRFYGAVDAPGGYTLFAPWPLPRDPATLPAATLEGFPPLMFRAGGLPYSAGATPDELELVEVTTPELLDECERVLVDGFPLAAFGRTEAPEWVPGSALDVSMLDVPDLRASIGRVEGRAVCTATSVLVRGQNHIEWVATLPDARGRGYGAAVTRHATEVAPELPALLIATDDGAPVYRRLGYITLQRWTCLTVVR